MTGFHGLGKGTPLRIKLLNGLKQHFIGNGFLLEDETEALALKGAGIQDLITAAGGSGQRDQEVRLMERQKLADRIRTGAGDDEIREGKEIL